MQAATIKRDFITISLHFIKYEYYILVPDRINNRNK